MDHTTCLDTVLIQSGLLPDQIRHPGFGVYLPLFFSEKIAHFFGILSALGLADIAGSLNPLAVMAELTDFVRLHSPFLSVGVVLLLRMAMQVIFGMSRWCVLLFLFSWVCKSRLPTIQAWCEASFIVFSTGAVPNRGVKKAIL